MPGPPEGGHYSAPEAIVRAQALDASHAQAARSKPRPGCGIAGPDDQGVAGSGRENDLTGSQTDAMRPPVTHPVLLILGSTLAASTLYLLALLFGYVFGIGHVRRHHVETASYVFVIAAALTAFSQTPPRRVQPSGTVRPRAAALLAGLVAASCVLYGNTLRLGLFSDDFVLAERALHGRWLSHGQFVRPLPSVLWGAILSVTRNPAALHLLSIVLHGANAALVSILASRIGLSRAAAVAAGLLFLAFPSNVEAVVWPAALPDLLVATCALAFLHLARGRISRERALAALAVLVCGLLCKESAIAIPLVAIVFWGVLPEGRRTAGWPVLASAIVICIAYAIVRITIVHLPESYAQVPSRYLLKELIARPFGTLVLPWTTVVLDRWPLFGYLPAFAVVAVGATYAGRPGKAVSPSLVAGYLLAALVAVLPVYSMLFISADLENARYLYLSTAFWATAVCGMASRPDDKARIGSARTVIFVVLIASAAVGVQWHLGAWREAAALRERVLAAAEGAMGTAPCSTVSLAAAPDSVRGAYVFRNGLAEAVAARAASRWDAAPAAGAPGDCLFVWDGTRFRATSNGPVAVQATFERQAAPPKGLN